MSNPTDGYNPTAEQQQNMDNLSFDREFKLNTVEALVYNPKTNKIDRMVQPGGKLDDFNVNNIKTVGLVSYIGMEDKDGVYCIKKIDSTTDNVFTYATITNNPTVTTYASAWSGILTNTYSIYSGAF